MVNPTKKNNFSGVNNGVCAFGYKNAFTTLLSTKNPESHVVGFTDSPQQASDSNPLYDTNAFFLA